MQYTLHILHGGVWVHGAHQPWAKSPVSFIHALHHRNTARNVPYREERAPGMTHVVSPELRLW